uniref:Uncharacterized protein n=1 Tax=Acrobeloides nanus TaxID=290746 RepID=A0A914C192_9BILA
MLRWSLIFISYIATCYATTIFGIPPLIVRGDKVRMCFIIDEFENARGGIGFLPNLYRPTECDYLIVDYGIIDDDLESFIDLALNSNDSRVDKLTKFDENLNKSDVKRDLINENVVNNSAIHEAIINRRKRGFFSRLSGEGQGLRTPDLYYSALRPPYLYHSALRTHEHYPSRFDRPKELRDIREIKKMENLLSKLNETRTSFEPTYTIIPNEIKGICYVKITIEFNEKKGKNQTEEDGENFFSDPEDGKNDYIKGKLNETKQLDEDNGSEVKELKKKSARIVYIRIHNKNSTDDHHPANVSLVNIYKTKLHTFEDISQANGHPSSTLVYFRKKNLVNLTASNDTIETFIPILIRYMEIYNYKGFCLDLDFIDTTNELMRFIIFLEKFQYVNRETKNNFTKVLKIHAIHIEFQDIIQRYSSLFNFIILVNPFDIATQRTIDEWISILPNNVILSIDAFGKGWSKEYTNKQSNSSDVIKFEDGCISTEEEHPKISTFKPNISQNLIEDEQVWYYGNRNATKFQMDKIKNPSNKIAGAATYFLNVINYAEKCENTNDTDLSYIADELKSLKQWSETTSFQSPVSSSDMNISTNRVKVYNDRVKYEAAKERNCNRGESDLQEPNNIQLFMKREDFEQIVKPVNGVNEVHGHTSNIDENLNSNGTHENKAS